MLWAHTNCVLAGWLRRLLLEGVHVEVIEVAVALCLVVGEVCGVYISVREACHKQVLMVWQKWCFVEV